MARKSRVTTPAYCLHKATGQGYVKLNGKTHYLGVHDQPETKQKYYRLLSEWELNGCQPIAPKEDMRVIDLIERYWQFAKSTYRKPDGTPTSQLERVRRVMRPLKDLYGYIPIRDFGGQELKCVRQAFIDAGVGRASTNSYVGVIKRCFKWGAEEGIVPSEVFGVLHVVSGLKKGRSEARESEPVRPVSLEDVEAVTSLVSPQVAAMIQLQLLTGARPGEIVRLRPVDIDMSEDIWVARLVDHKTAHHDKERTILIGLRGQEIIYPYLQDRAIHMPLFSPREAEQHRCENANTHRRANQMPTPKRTNRTLGDTYTVPSYRRAIHRACDKASINRWSPNQLRHTAATRIRAEFGLEAAQVVLGHSKADVTQVYAERNTNFAKEVTRQIG